MDLSKATDVTSFNQLNVLEGIYRLGENSAEMVWHQRLK